MLVSLFYIKKREFSFNLNQLVLPWIFIILWIYAWCVLSKKKIHLQKKSLDVSMTIKDIKGVYDKKHKIKNEIWYACYFCKKYCSLIFKYGLFSILKFARNSNLFFPHQKYFITILLSLIKKDPIFSFPWQNHYICMILGFVICSSFNFNQSSSKYY